MHVNVAAILLAAVIWCGAPAPSAAQLPGGPPRAEDATTLDELVLKDGSRLYGAVLRETAEQIVFRTQAGVELTVRRADVASVRHVTGRVVRDEFWRADPNVSRLFFAPTGRSIPQGQVYLGVFQILMPFVQVGITDRLSFGGGTPLVFGFDDEWQRPFWVTPKLQVVRRERAQVAVGTFHIFDTDGDGGGIAYAVGTFGRPDTSVTIGLGGTYTGFDGGGGVVMVGAERQVHRHIKAVTENYVWKGGEGILTGGFRFFGERLSADVGLAIPLHSGDLIVFPVVNFVYLFR